MSAELASILLADDDEDDRMLTQEALAESRLENPLHFVEDGQELLDYLFHKGKYVDTEKYPRPGLILLDLNMPRLDGKSALQIIKTDPQLKSIPVVVLTTTNQDIEATKSYDLGANSFIVKPVNFEKLVEVIRVLGKYWFSIVKRVKE